jgi:hypothetical protein
MEILFCTGTGRIPLGQIIFEKVLTNACAANLNSKIRRFVMINSGAGDRYFFYFRVMKYFT